VGEKRGRREKQEKEGGEMSEMKVKLIIFLLFSCYFLALMPYIVHTNLASAGAGVIKAVHVVHLQTLPTDLRDVTAFIVGEMGDSESKEKDSVFALLLRDSVSNERTAVLVVASQSSGFRSGEVVEVTDKIVDWFVDWHAYNFFGEQFSNLIVGRVEQVSEFESAVEGMLGGPGGAAIFSLSKLTFYIAPFLLFPFVSRFRFRLWLFPAIVSAYAFEIFLFNSFAYLHALKVSDMSRYFGYSFIFFALLSFILWRFEESELGKRKIEKFYKRVNEYFARLFE